MTRPIPFKTIAPALTGWITALIFIVFGDALLANLSNHPQTVALFVWLFGVMLWCALAVVQQGGALADYLGEPYDTLVLTLSVIIVGVALLTSIMLQGENNPTLARDAMFATLMIVLNGMVGAALLMGALRYW